jgi:hypothetical protein
MMIDNQLYAAELALKKLENGGAPQIILDHIARNLRRIHVNYDFSNFHDVEIFNNKVYAILEIGQTINSLDEVQQTAALNTALLLLRSKH